MNHIQTLPILLLPPHSDINNQSTFLRVEIILTDATYFIVFMDADSMPPPFRIDNFSEVPITYYQVEGSYP